jgi:PAS domain S-box-containing protein
MKNKELLDSWKEVSSYMGKGVRTVQRWEKELGLPVRRRTGKQRGQVFAFRFEIDAWQHSQSALKAQSAPRDGVQFRQLFETALDGILIADDSGTYLEVNPAACTLLGWSPNQIVGSKVADLCLVEADEFAQLWESFLQKGQMRGRIHLRGADGPVEVEYAARAHFTPGRHFSVIRRIGSD